MQKLLRKPKQLVQIKNKQIGDKKPILIQSMTNTKTKDVNATVNQIKKLIDAGCDIVRVAVLDKEDALAIKEIKSKVDVALVADIHFDFKLALLALDCGVDKLRINPGNIGNIENIKAVVEKCKEKKVPIRIGVNSGSVEKEILDKYGSPTYQALVESAKKHVDILETLGFYDIVISIKSSDIKTTIQAYQLANEVFPYPLHIGITEAGTEYSGLVKSSIGLGILLYQGIGDTIRVSLSADPILEVKAAKEILASLSLYDKPNLIACPTCGRTEYNMLPIVEEVEQFLSNINKKITVAIMGCVVNGPGEAKEADIGIAGGKNCAVLFKKGQIIKKLEYNEILPELKKEILKLTN